MDGLQRLRERSESIFRAEVAAPVLGGGVGEAGFDADFIVDFEDDVLRSVAAAFAFAVFEGIPVGAGLAGASGGAGGVHDGMSRFYRVLLLLLNLGGIQSFSG